MLAGLQADAGKSVTTTALDISLHNAHLFGGLISGDIRIGQSYAGSKLPAPEPTGLLVMAAPLFGLISLHRRKLLRGAAGRES
jgi:hypothetical protein